MVNLHLLKTVTLFVSPFLLACAGRGWRTVEAQFGRANVEIATCSSEQIERCEEIKTRLETGETVTILDPEYVRYLAMGRESHEGGEGAIAQPSLFLFNTIYPTERQNEWIAEVWVKKDGISTNFESLFSLTPDFAIEFALSSIYRYAIMLGGEYRFDRNDGEESYMNAFLEIHRQKKIRYMGPLSIGRGNTGTRGCSIPVDDILERQFSNE